MNWYNILKIAQKIDLPPIPEWMVRLIHITQASPDHFFNRGFDYSRQGAIQGTTRDFLSNEDLLSDGLFLKDPRFRKGYAIIIDIPQEESKIHSSYMTDRTMIIPPKFIYGAFSSEENKWILNPSYNPSGSSIPEGYSYYKQDKLNKQRDNSPVPIPSPSDINTNTDVF